MASDTSNAFDVGPLSWVAGEIDQALTRGHDALAAFAAAPADATPLKHARAHVHQAFGAIQMVGLDAVMPYAEEIERGLAELEQAGVEGRAARCEAIDRACRRLKAFLGEVVMGAPLVALRLLPEYDAMQHARGIKAVAPADLFYPDLSPRAPLNLATVTSSTEAPAMQLVRQRRVFQQGLLLWLRGEAGGARSMREAVGVVEGLTSQPGLRAFWWTVGALFEALEAKGLDASFGAKQLAARIDLQIRRLVEGSTKVADRLRREVLYYVAISAPVTPTVREVQARFGLAALVPSTAAASADVVRIEPLLRVAREQLAAAKEAWLKFTSGRAENLPRLKQTMSAVHAQVAEVGDPALARLTASLAARLDAMPAINLPEALAMEYATGLLLAESACENYASLAPDFPAQVDAMLARLDAVQANRPLTGAAAAPVLDEMSRRAQERLLLAQVVREIQVNLRRIEQVLDAFFRDHTKRAELASLAKDSRQIGGALRILGLDQADQLLSLCQAQIESYADPEAIVSNDDLELLAESLSSLGFYVEAVEQQRPDRERLIAPLLARRLGHATAARPDDRGESVETAVEELRSALPEIVAEVHRAPTDAAARADLRGKLADLRDDAELIGDKSLAAQAGTALKELAEGGDKALAAAVDAIAESGAPAPAPEISAETQRLLAADESGLDAEFLDIYLTEAGEVLDTVAEHRTTLGHSPGAREALRTVRRGFHTLKGSGRMVGLTELGEIAFDIEKILNVLLEEERAVTPAVLALIEVAERSFRGWVASLHETGRVRPDPAALHAAIRAVEAQLPAGRASVLVRAAAVPAPAAAPAAAPAPEPIPAPAAEPPFAAPEIEEIEFADVGSIGAAPSVVYAESEGEEFAVEEPVDEIAPALAATPAATVPQADADEVTIGDVTLSASLYRILCDEADQHLATLDSELGAMAFDPAHQPSSAMVRASHTLYGIHRTAGIPLVAYTAKALEQCVLGLQQAAAPVPEAAIPVLRRAVDGLGALVGRVKARQPFGGADETEALEVQYALEALRPEAPPGPMVDDAELLAAHEAARDEEALALEAEAGAASALEAERLHAAEDEAAARAEEAARAEAVARAEEAARAEAAARAEDAARADAAARAAEAARVAVEAARAEAAAKAEEAARIEAAVHAEAAERAAAAAKAEEAEEAARVEAAVHAEAAERAAEAARAEAAAHADAAAKAESVARAEAAARAAEAARIEEAARADAEAKAQAAAAMAAAAALAAAAHAGAAPAETTARIVPEFVARPRPPAAANEIRVPTTEDALADVRDDVDAQILPIFLEEAAELFPRAGEELRAWQHAPTDAPSAQRLRRTLHTFKGSARMAGAMRLGELTHRMESRLLDGDMHVDPPPALFELLEIDLDRIAFVLDALRRGDVDVELPWIAAGAEDTDAAAMPQMPATSAPIVVPGAPVPVGEAPAQPNVVPLVPRAPVPAVAPPAAAAEGESGQRAMLRVRADVIDRLVNEAGEVAIARTRIDAELRSLKANLLELTSSVIRLRTQVREIEIQGESQIQSRMSHVSETAPGFDPLEFDRYTRFQELTRSLAEGVNDVATVQQALLKNLDDADAALLAQGRLSRDIQQQLFSIRTVPFGSLSERLYRILRQTARELDKRANLEIRGAQVELDRAVLEKLVGPLEHLLRNALDHGVELRTARVVAGKSETGEIALTVRQVGNEIAIELADDGAGLDFAQIRDKAVKDGTLAPDAQPTEAQLIERIFQPGFSTATRVTAVSGRGIGMDVVRSEVAALGGRVEVTTRPGAGTTFLLYLPLTLAVAQAVLVRAGGRLWALPAPMVEQVQQIKPEALINLYLARSVEWQGRSYPFHYLCRLLGDEDSHPETARHNSVLLLRAGQNVAAVHVDEMVGNQEVVVKNIGPQLARVTGIAGATVLGTGEIVLIINPVQLAQRAGLPVAFDPSGPDRLVPGYLPVAKAAASGPPLVMIVDDSLTVRKITSRLLVREGFAVITAKDGIDALEMLEEQVPEVILLDIEMPRMDGFEFTRSIKRDPRFAHIPVIMITSRTAEKHRNLARELGVDLYLGKPFQEDELLRNLREMLAITS